MIRAAICNFLSPDSFYAYAFPLATLYSNCIIIVLHGYEDAFLKTMIVSLPSWNERS